MKIALFSNSNKPSACQAAQAVTEYLKQRDIQVIALPESQQRSIQKIHKDLSFCLIVGGDGTILRFFHTFPTLRAPLLGINQGGLGFMADVPIADLIPCLDDLLKGNFEIQKRTVLGLSMTEISKQRALNEVIFHRGLNNGIIELSVFCGQKFVNTFSGDGLIIATPNGSTAYSLSAGGPILSPELSALVLTPICPHALAHRPLVLSARAQLRVVVTASKTPIDVVVDGFRRLTLKQGESATIAQHPSFFRWIDLSRRDYFATLRNKLSWSGSLKNSS